MKSDANRAGSDDLTTDPSTSSPFWDLVWLTATVIHHWCWPCTVFYRVVMGIANIGLQMDRQDRRDDDRSSNVPWVSRAHTTPPISDINRKKELNSLNLLLVTRDHEKPTNWFGEEKPRATKIRPKAVIGAIFDSFLCDNCRQEVASGVVSGSLLGRLSSRSAWDLVIIPWSVLEKFRLKPSEALFSTGF